MQATKIFLIQCPYDPSYRNIWDYPDSVTSTQDIFSILTAHYPNTEIFIENEITPQFYEDINGASIEMATTSDILRKYGYAAIQTVSGGWRFGFIQSFNCIAINKFSVSIAWDQWTDNYFAIRKTVIDVDRAHCDRYEKTGYNTATSIFNGLSDSEAESLVSRIEVPDYDVLSPQGNSANRILWLVRILNNNDTGSADPCTGIDFTRTNTPYICTPFAISYRRDAKTQLLPVSAVRTSAQDAPFPEAGGRYSLSVIDDFRDIYANSVLTFLQPFNGEAYAEVYEQTKIRVVVPDYTAPNGYTVGGQTIPEYYLVKFNPFASANDGQIETVDLYSEQGTAALDDSFSWSPTSGIPLPEPKFSENGFENNAVSINGNVLEFGRVAGTDLIKIEHRPSPNIYRLIDGEETEVINIPPIASLASSVSALERFLQANSESYYTAYAAQKRDAALGIAGSAFSLGSGIVGAALGNPFSIGSIASGGQSLIQSIFSYNDVEKTHNAKIADLSKSPNAVTIPSQNAVDNPGVIDAPILIRRKLTEQTHEVVAGFWQEFGYPYDGQMSFDSFSRYWFDYRRGRVVKIDPAINPYACPDILARFASGLTVWHIVYRSGTYIDRYGADPAYINNIERALTPDE